jgi:hypothetical protein
MINNSKYVKIRFATVEECQNIAQATAVTFSVVMQRTIKMKSNTFICGHSARMCNNISSTPHYVQRGIGSLRNKCPSVRGV